MLGLTYYVGTGNLVKIDRSPIVTIVHYTKAMHVIYSCRYFIIHAYVAYVAHCIAAGSNKPKNRGRQPYGELLHL